MKFGITYNTGYYGADPGNMAAIARHAEACGFESFYVPEHIALYPGATGGIEFPPSLAVADPLECLSYVAAATERILLGTAVLLLPYHHPVVLAKRLATIGTGRTSRATCPPWAVRVIVPSGLDMPQKSRSAAPARPHLRHAGEHPADVSARRGPVCRRRRERGSRLPAPPGTTTWSRTRA